MYFIHGIKNSELPPSCKEVRRLIEMIDHSASRTMSLEEALLITGHLSTCEDCETLYSDTVSKFDVKRF